MTINTSMLDNMLLSSSAPAAPAAPAASAESAPATANFKDILKGTIASTKTDTPVFKEKTEPESSVSSDKTPPQNNSVNNRKTDGAEAADKNTSDSNVERKVTGKSEDESKSDTKPLKKKDSKESDIMLGSLAQLLGLNPAELMKLLNAAGINPEEMTTSTDMEEVASKLTEALGLGQGPGDALKDILVQMQSLVEEAVGQQSAAANGKGTAVTIIRSDDDATDQIAENLQKLVLSMVEAQTATTTETPANVPELSEIDKLVIKLKLKIKEIITDENSETGKLAEKISVSVKIMVKAIESHTEEAGATGSNTSVTDNAADEMDVATAAQANTGTSEEESSEGTTGTATASTTAAASTPTASTADEQLLVNTIASVNQTQATVATEDIQKVQTSPKVLDSEIISQVIEKAKVVITGDKTEMALELKPESLGKLSLKIVTEQGIVMAKFVAESQQVKQVLESNMQTLKESLERQGLNVQGFSVSVRQDSNRGNRENNSNGKENSGGIGSVSRMKLNMSVKGIYGSADDTNRLQTNNPYSLTGSSTINLTA